MQKEIKMKKLLSLLAVNQAGGVGGDALHAACEAEALGGGGFDGDVALPDAHEGREGALHSGYVGVELGLLRADSGVDVSHAVALCSEECHHLLENHLAVHAECFVGGVGKMIADVAQGSRPKQGVADGMHKHVGVAVPQKTVMVLQLDASQPQFAPLNQLVHVEPESYSCLHVISC